MSEETEPKTGETIETSKKKKKVVWGIFISLFVIALIVGSIWLYGYFQSKKPPAGTQAVDGEVIASPCSDSDNDTNCVQIKYNILEEDKDKGEANGSVEQTYLWKQTGAATKYKQGDKLTVYYWRDKPTVVHDIIKK
jgi:flagellar basal body-associated protein FliL